jgi:protein tyrosine phosphatase type 4A
MEFNATLIETKVRYFPSGSTSNSSNEPTAGGGGGGAAASAAKKSGGGTVSAGSDITLRLLILDAPSAQNLGNYITALQHAGVKHLVRVCAQRYRSDIVEMANIKTHAWPFEDGSPPPQPVLDQWLALVDAEIRGVGEDGRCPLIAIHCVAGLGRAPILVAVALVEFGTFAPLDAVSYIRERRKGSINQVQLDWLMQYTPRRDREGLLFKLCMCCPQQ